MRVLLFTGKGGVGKTTVAAASAAHIASRGGKTLVVSTDPAHSLADTFGVRLGGEPTEVDTGLYALQIQTQRRFEQIWREIRHYVRGLLGQDGAASLQAEELTVLPGAEEVLALLEVRDQVGSGRWDAVVVDCAATAETLRLLALPDTLAWYMERVFPTHRRVLRTVRPLLGRFPAGTLPSESVLDAVTRMHAELTEVQALLRSPDVSPRLVLTPELVVVAEARRTLTGMALLGFRVDEVVANRVFPPGGDAWRAGWARAQRRLLAEVGQSFAGMPLRSLSYRPGEPVGLPALLDLAAELYGDDDPLAVTAGEPLMRVERDGATFVLVLALPLAERGEVALARSGDDLVLTVAGRRRLVALPSVLRRCEVEGADLRAGSLRVRFRPDPAQWPSGLDPWPGR